MSGQVPTIEMTHRGEPARTRDDQQKCMFDAALVQARSGRPNRSRGCVSFYHPGHFKRPRMELFS
jgi:hypothetical protein